MTIEEKQKEYESHIEDKRAMRKLLDEDTSVIKFNKSYNIETLGDIIYWGIIKRTDTYFNGDLYQEQCPDGKRRTIEDIYKIQRSYGLGLPYKTVKRALDELTEVKMVEWVFCKATYTRTHGKVSYTTTIEQINEVLDKLNLNNKSVIKQRTKKSTL